MIIRELKIKRNKELKLRKKDLYDELEYIEFKKMELYSELNKVKDDNNKIKYLFVFIMLNTL